MLCVTLKNYLRACGGVTGGLSDITVFDPNDYSFSQAAKVDGVAQPYTAITLRAGAEPVGATAPTATITITAVGTDGDVFQASIGTTVLATVTKTSAETTVTLLAVKIKDAINTLTSTHAYTATNSSGVITVTAPTIKGATLNGTHITVEDGGTIAATDTAWTGGVTGTGGGKVYLVNFQQDEAEHTWKQSVKGCAVKYDHEFIFQLPENGQSLTTFLEALDAASCCCGLGMAIRYNSGKIFLAGEKYVNGVAIPRFTMKNDGSDGGSGKLFDDFNGGNIHLKGSFSRALYEYTGSWADFEALM